MGLEKLKKLVETLDLSEIDRFQQKRRKRVGRKGNKMSSYARAWILRRILGIPSEAQLARKVKNPEMRILCRFRKAPCKSSYCRARKRLGCFGIDFLFCFLVRKAKELGLATGRIVAVDSTDFSAFCNPEKEQPSDKDAKWGYSKTKGFVFGYKMHYFVDAESELPLAAIVLPANVNDAVGFFPAFEKLGSVFTVIWKLLADCAYDALEIRKKAHGIALAIARNGRGRFESESPKDPDFVKRGAIERVNSRGKEGLGLDNLKMRGLWAATFHATEVLCSMMYAAVGSFLAGFSDWRSIVNLRE
jgi:transposase